MLFSWRFRMPVELVRGGIALGDANGWDGGWVGEVEAKGPVVEEDGIVKKSRGDITTVRYYARCPKMVPGGTKLAMHCQAQCPRDYLFLTR
jgi:hypothetical protein